MTQVERTGTTPRPLSYRETGPLAVEENARFVALIAALGPAEWECATDCTQWDVRAVVGHVLGAMEGHASVLQFIHQTRAGKKAAGDGPLVDGMSAVQVAGHAHLRTDQAVARLREVAPRAARRRGRIPAPLRALPMRVEIGGHWEWWSLGYFFGTILTRDTWMHRIDICRATGRPVVITPEHDGRIVADLVAEWSRRHDKPFALRLDGPAGGVFGRGANGEEITMDAIEFCRTLSGRETGTGLLAQTVPF